MKNDLQYLVVKVIIRKNGSESFGSGTIVQIDSVYYVITAEHCVFGKEGERETFKDVTVEDITIEHRKTFNEPLITIPVVSIVEKSEPKDYIILEIEDPTLDFNYKSVNFGSFSDGNNKRYCIFRGYAKAHENEPRNYDCKYIEKSSHQILLQLNDTLNNPTDYGIEVASGLSGSGIFYIEGDNIYLIGIFTSLRNEQGTYDDFFASSIDSVDFLSDKIVVIENDLLLKSAKNILLPFQSKLGIPNVDFVLSEINHDNIGTHISKRIDAIQDLNSELSHCNWLAISGPIYSGKTELLKLLNYSFGDAKSIFIKISNDETEETIIQRIQVANNYKREVIIIDNIPQLKNGSKLLSFLIQISQQSTIKIVTSSRFTLPTIIKSYSNIIPKNIPDFTKENVEEIIRSYNQLDKAVNTYGTFILTISKKNPAIISSLCSFFDSKQWKIDINDFVKVINGKYDNGFQIQLNNELHDTVTDPLNRELLNRLQLHIGSFDRNIVDIVGRVSPEIPELNSKFLSLFGNWILPASPNLYIVSPLLQIINNGNLDLSTPVSLSINIVLAENIIKKKTLNQFDVQNIIIYYMRANKPNEAGYFYVGFMIIAIDNIEQLKKSIFSYYWIDIPLPDDMDISLKIQIRIFQFYFLNSAKRDYSYIVTDIEGLSKKAKKGIEAYLVNSLLGTLCSNPDKLNPKSFHYLKEAYENLNDIEPGILQQIQQSKDNKGMLWLTFSQINDQSDIDSWFNMLEKTKKEEISELESLDMYEASTFLFFKRLKEIALDEIKENKDCNNILKLLHYLFEKLKSYPLETTRLQALCLIIDLYDLMSKKDDAFKLFSDEIDTFYIIENKCILYFAIFKVLLSEGKEKIGDVLTSDVESMIENCIKNRLHSTTILDGLCVLTSYCRDIDIKKSLHYSKLAYDYSINDEDFEIISQTLIAGEYAVALWFNNKVEECVNILDIGFTKLLSIVSDDDKYKVLIIKYGILIRYIALRNKDEEENYVVPSIGMFFLTPNTDKLIEIYDPIRDYFNCHFMFEIYKIFKKKEKRKKWALKSYNLAKRIPNNPFSTLMVLYIPYLIENKLYEDVINIIYKDKEEVERLKLGESRYLELIKKIQPERESLIVEIPIHNGTTEEENLGLYILPMLMDALNYYLENNNNTKYLSKIVQVLKSYVVFSSNKSLVEECIEIIEDFIDGNGIFDYNFPLNNNSNTLKSIVYLLSSLSQNEKKAFELQMSIIVYLDSLFKYYESEKDMLLYSFFRTFWLNRIDKCPSGFEDYKSLKAKGLDRINVGSGGNLNRLFRVLSNHITIKLSIDQENWLDL